MKVFYSPKQSVPPYIILPSPSASKPAILVERWSKLFPIEIQDFEPLTREDFYLAHDKDFVDAVLNCETYNGFGTIDVEVTKTLYWTSGSFYAAALEALTQKEITCSPSAGFHHAEYAECGGFCTFNGLMVTALKLLGQFSALKIGILDCDQHYGNGTEDILIKKNLKCYLESTVGNSIKHYTFGNFGKEKERYNWKAGPEAEKWLARLPEILHFFSDRDLILYQAGADPHVEDGGALSTEQMSRRDELVFKFCLEKGIPIVWNLAGGYLTPLERVLEIHDNTMRQALTYQFTKEAK